jgi:hypothetical protein
LCLALFFARVQLVRDRVERRSALAFSFVSVSFRSRSSSSRALTFGFGSGFGFPGSSSDSNVPRDFRPEIFLVGKFLTAIVATLGESVSRPTPGGVDPELGRPPRRARAPGRPIDADLPRLRVSYQLQVTTVLHLLESFPKRVNLVLLAIDHLFEFSDFVSDVLAGVGVGRDFLAIDGDAVDVCLFGRVDVDGPHLLDKSLFVESGQVVAQQLSAHTEGAADVRRQDGSLFLLDVGHGLQDARSWVAEVGVSHGYLSRWCSKDFATILGVTTAVPWQYQRWLVRLVVDGRMWIDSGRQAVREQRPRGVGGQTVVGSVSARRPFRGHTHVGKSASAPVEVLARQYVHLLV